MCCRPCVPRVLGHLVWLPASELFALCLLHRHHLQHNQPKAWHTRDLSGGSFWRDPSMSRPVSWAYEVTDTGVGRRCSRIGLPELQVLYSCGQIQTPLSVVAGGAPGPMGCWALAPG